MYLIIQFLIIGAIALLIFSFRKKVTPGMALQEEITQKISDFKNRIFSSYEEEQSAKQQQLRKELLGKVEKEAHFAQKKALQYLVNTL